MAESLGNGCYIFGIFDGHGNSVVSNKVAHILPKMIKEEIKSRNIVPGEGHSIESKIADLDWVELINTIFDKIDKVLWDTLKPEEKNGGSCAAVALITTKNVYTINLGDSRVYVYSKFQGSNLPNIIAKTDDHKPLRPSERIRICENGGSVYFGRISMESIFAGLAVARAFGDFQYKKMSPNDKPSLSGNLVICEPEITVTPLSEVGAISILCDGVSDVMNEADILENYHKHSSRSKYLTICAYRKGSNDNISSCFIDFHNFPQIHEADRDKQRSRDRAAQHLSQSND